jgi:multiple sugar transport system substrate-binding protein
MRELEITLMSAFANPPPAMRALVEDFEAEHHCRVNIHTTQWINARAELVNFTIFRDSPAISEVGSTWIGGFNAMNALRPFSNSEINWIGNSAVSIPVLWNAGILTALKISTS